RGSNRFSDKLRRTSKQRKPKKTSSKKKEKKKKSPKKDHLSYDDSNTDDSSSPRKPRYRMTFPADPYTQKLPTHVCPDGRVLAPVQE
ncbi:hypothetical protein PFISCL1PPCAC_758, partial [Pristionchus fissidentatus]